MENVGADATDEGFKGSNEMLEITLKEGKEIVPRCD